MTDPVLDKALDALETPGADVVIWTSSAELARLALSRLGDRARERALDVRLRFGYRALQRGDGRGRIRILSRGGDLAAGVAPTLELDLSDA